jgi:hypothetical protein
MSLTGVIIGAGIGATVAVGFGLLKKAGGSWIDKVPNWVFSVIAVTTVVVGIRVIGPVADEWLAIKNLDGHLSDNPAFAALKRHEPAVYKAMIQKAEAAHGNGASLEAAVGVMRSELGPLVEKKVPVASDESAADYMAIMILEAGDLYAGNDDACYAFMFPGNGAVNDFTKRVPAHRLSADTAALAKLIESAATKPNTRVTIEQVQPDLQPIVLSIAEKYGKDFDLINSPQTTLPAKRRVCSMIIDLYGRILELPKQQAGRVLRAMLNQP